MTLNRKETSTNFLEIKDDILYIVVKADADLGLEQMIEAVDARKKLQHGKKMLVLVDNRKMWQLSKEANEYCASREVGELSIAMAILSGSFLPTRIINNFFIKINSAYCPTKIFKDEDKAIEWLNHFK